MFCSSANARRVLRARVLVALVLAELLLHVGGRLEDRRDDRARRGIGLLSGVDADGGEAGRVGKLHAGVRVSFRLRREWPGFESPHRRRRGSAMRRSSPRSGPAPRRRRRRAICCCTPGPAVSFSPPPRCGSSSRSLRPLGIALGLIEAPEHARGHRSRPVSRLLRLASGRADEAPAAVARPAQADHLLHLHRRRPGAADHRVLPPERRRRLDERQRVPVQGRLRRDRRRRQPARPGDRHRCRARSRRC